MSNERLINTQQTTSRMYWFLVVSFNILWGLPALYLSYGLFVDLIVPLITEGPSTLTNGGIDVVLIFPIIIALSAVFVIGLLYGNLRLIRSKRNNVPLPKLLLFVMNGIMAFFWLVYVVPQLLPLFGYQTIEDKYEQTIAKVAVAQTYDDCRQIYQPFYDENKNSSLFEQYGYNLYERCLGKVLRATSDFQGCIDFPDTVLSNQKSGMEVFCIQTFARMTNDPEKCSMINRISTEGISDPESYISRRYQGCLNYSTPIQR